MVAEGIGPFFVIRSAMPFGIVPTHDNIAIHDETMYVPYHFPSYREIILHEEVSG